jgi:HK97 gp10 family phage protein
MPISAKATFRPRNDLGRFVEVKISPAVRASVQAGCQLIQDAAQHYAPVRTGALRDSITTEIDDSGKTIIGRVSPHVPYAEFLEYGTVHMSPRPFMRPAFDENRGAIEDLFRHNVALALEE